MKYGRSGGALRTALFALAALLLLALPALAASDGVANYRALLIGNSEYQSLDDLQSCAYDLGAMRSALTSGTVAYKKISSYSSLTRSGIQSALSGVLSWGADDDDVTVIYYTGHGASSGLAGVDHSSFKDGVYPFSLLQSALSNVPGKVIVLLDACESGGLINKSAAGADSFAESAVAAFSGASGGLSSKAITSGEKFHVIASSSQDQSSWAKTDLCGLTTWALCEAMGWSHNGPQAGNRLESLEGDDNEDLTVTVGEAYGHAAQAVSEELAKYGHTQDMKAYPENSGLQLITRAAAAVAVETPKASYKSGVLNLTAACIAPGKTLQLQLNVPDATNVKWGSSKNAVATVDPHTGLVTGVKSSYAYRPEISVLYKDGEKWYTAFCLVRVRPSRYVVQSVKPRYATKTLEKGFSYTMPVTVTPSSARYKALRWSSDDDTVAKVDSKSGRITAVAESGTAVITATATSGVTASVTVNAIPATPTSVRLDNSRLTLLEGRTRFLVETVKPAAASDKRVDWKSNKETVATVNKDGQVYAVGTGRAVITCTTIVGERKATCTVTVVANQSIPRTKPKSVPGQLKASARKIYYNESGMLCVDMFFYNRTGYPQTAPLTEEQALVLKLRSGKQLNAVTSSFVRQTVPNRAWRVITIKVSPTDNPQFRDLDLRGSDAWCQVL